MRLKGHTVRLCCAECFRHVLKAPCSPAPGGEALPVQFVRNLPRSVARRLQFPNAKQDALLRRVPFQVQAVCRHAVAEWDRSHPLTDLAELLERFTRRGVSLVSVAESLDTSL